jgi:hypothetical protein
MLGFTLRKTPVSGANNATTKRERVMNKEYLEAKFDLCINQAEKNLKEEEIAEAIKNLRRANSALSQLFGFEEDENE